MLPALANLPDAHRGDTYGPIAFEFFDENDSPIELPQDAVVKCEVALKENYRKTFLQWPSSTHGITLTANMIILEEVPFDEMKFDAGIYFYDLEITIGGYTKTYLKGNLTVHDEITNY